MEKINAKCRYCGSDMYLHTAKGQNWITEQDGFITTLSCSSAGCCFIKIFSLDSEDIPNAEKKALECYGVKGNDNDDRKSCKATDENVPESTAKQLCQKARIMGTVSDMGTLR